ncbi:MAG: MFS transporter, partial [Bacillota bacterium]
IPAGIIIPIAGFLSDRIGRKTIMAPAVAVYGLGGLIAGVAALLIKRPFPIILVGRIIQGIGAGGTYQLAMALTGDIFQSKERTKALGYLEASNGLGKVVSPIAGAAAAAIFWWAPFFVYGILSIPIALAIWFIVKEKTRSKGNQQDLKTYFHNFANIVKTKGGSLWPCFLAGSVVLFVLFGVLSFYCDVLENELGIDGILRGVIIAGPVFAMAVVSLITGIYLQNHIGKSLKWFAILGLIFTTAGSILIPFFRGPILMFIATVFVGLGTGLVLPSVNMLITSAASIKERGLLTCLYGTVRFFGVAMGPPVFDFINKVGRLPVFGAVAILAGLSVLAVMFFVNTNILIPEDLMSKQGSQKQDKQQKAKAGDQVDKDLKQELTTNPALFADQAASDDSATLADQVGGMREPEGRKAKVFRPDEMHLKKGSKVK